MILKKNLHVFFALIAASSTMTDDVNYGHCKLHYCLLWIMRV